MFPYYLLITEIIFICIQRNFASCVIIVPDLSSIVNRDWLRNIARFTASQPTDSFEPNCMFILGKLVTRNWSLWGVREFGSDWTHLDTSSHYQRTCDGLSLQQIPVEMPRSPRTNSRRQGFPQDFQKACRPCQKGTLIWGKGHHKMNKIIKMWPKKLPITWNDTKIEDMTPPRHSEGMSGEAINTIRHVGPDMR